MIKLPQHPDLQAVATRTVWFKPPADAIDMPIHFIAHVLTFGTHEDVTTLRKFNSDEELAEAVTQAPPSVFDPRSWAYWNLKIGRYPAPPMPVRTIPDYCGVHSAKSFSTAPRRAEMSSALVHRDPHSGQMSGVARKSYPQAPHLPCVILGGLRKALIEISIPIAHLNTR